MAKNILFVCSRNQWRSPTAENIYKSNSAFNVRSAGTELSARIKVTAKLIEWADIIFTMEKKHKQRLIENFPVQVGGKTIIVLDIPDEYQFMDHELVEMIKLSAMPYLDKLL
jgi:predicted protein tyrosine phosphatase